MKNIPSVEEFLGRDKGSTAPSLDVTERVMRTIREHHARDMQVFERQLRWSAALALILAACFVVPGLMSWQSLSEPLNLLYGTMQASL